MEGRAVRMATPVRVLKTLLSYRSARPDLRQQRRGEGTPFQGRRCKPGSSAQLGPARVIAKRLFASIQTQRHLSSASRSAEQRRA